MTRNRSLLFAVAGVSLFVLCFAVFTVPAEGAKRKPNNGPALIAELLNPSGVYGVSSDGAALYTDSVEMVQCYFGVGGKDFDLVTYNSGRTLRFAFDPTAVAFQNSGLPATFDAEVDIFGINYWGRYLEMGVGTTAQVQSDLEFYNGRETYELDYQSLAAFRVNADTWLITTDQSDLPGYPGFWPSDQAKLNVIRRRSQESFGTVNMPIRFYLKLK